MIDSETSQIGGGGGGGAVKMRTCEVFLWLNDTVKTRI